MIALYSAQARTYREIEALARMQENARHAFEIMGYDLRMGGNWTCYVPGQAVPANYTPTNYLNNAANTWWTHSNRPVFGMEETADGNAAGDANFPADFGANALRGDTVMVLRADQDGDQAAVGPGPAAYDLGAGNIPVTGANFQDGTLLVLTDCRFQTAIFQKSGGGVGSIQHAVGPPPNPGNCQGHLNVGGSCAAAGTTQDVTDARIYPLSAHAYYVRNSPRRYANSNVNIPALYRQALTTAGGNATTTAEELVDGVIDMQVLYGVDTDVNPDRQIDSYLPADQVVAPAVPGANEAERWRRVLAVRVTLTLESTENNLATANQTFTFGNGANVTDRRLRRQYTATFGLRGRL
jgi:type IV pilus assembly protein PilW